MLKSLKSSKIVLENLKEQLRRPGSFPESSLNNVTSYIKNIEGISQVCEDEVEINQCKELIEELNGSLLLFVRRCITEIKSSRISLEKIDNGRFEKALSYYKLTHELFTEKDQ